MAKKDGTKTGGRSKGTPNKITSELKTMILEALENKGGIEYLEKQADNNPNAFMTLLGRIIPLQVNADITMSPLETLAKDLNGNSVDKPGNMIDEQGRDKPSK